VIVHVSETVVLSDADVQERFVRAQGARGQNPKHQATAVELRYDVTHADVPDEVKARLVKIAGSRMTLEGVLVLFAQGARSQEMNRQDARARLAELVRRATEKPKPRRPTKPTYSSKLKRLEAKSQRSSIKSARGRVRDDG